MTQRLALALPGEGREGAFSLDRGEEILLEAKILAVADVVEAMASHRPYRPALGVQAALKEISRQSGVLYMTRRRSVLACGSLKRRVFI